MDLTWDLYNPTSRANRILVVAPSLGGNCSHQWAKVAELLTNDAQVVFVDYPGHALSEVWNDADEPTLDVVASAIMDVIHEVRERTGELPVIFAGLSIGGATGLHLARDHADELAGVGLHQPLLFIDVLQVLQPQGGRAMDGVQLAHAAKRRLPALPAKGTGRPVRFAGHQQRLVQLGQQGFDGIEQTAQACTGFRIGTRH